MTVEKLITDHIDIWSSALQTRSTAGRGSNGKIDLYGIKKLRELILELAVRGKLVPQDPNDEPASELLKRIAAEKAELVKQGKIKKQKLLPEISEDETPFELPAGWEWRCFDEIINQQYPISYGVLVPGEPEVGGVPFVRIGDIAMINPPMLPEKTISHLVAAKYERTRLNGGEILMAVVGSIGKLGVAPDSWKGANIARALCRIVPVSNLSKEFILLLLQSKLMQASFKGDTRTLAQPTLNVGLIKTSITPIPPITEQYRIVAKVNELMSLSDQLEQQSLTSLDAHQQLVETLLATLVDSQHAEELAENWARISQHFDTLFTTEASIDALKQTILQLAVMGKLVPQDPNDEPASELLKRIEQEKAQLVKEGKIKKQKPLPPVNDEEKPFELPKGWEWCRLGSLFNFQNGYAFKSEWFSDNGIRLVRNTNISHGNINWNDSVNIPLSMFSEFEGFSLNLGDVLMSLDRPIINTGLKYAFVRECDLPCLLLQRVAKFNSIGNVIRSDFLSKWLESNYFINSIDPGRSNGVPHISTKQLEMTLFPLLSQREQDKIILLTDKLIQLCVDFKSHLQSAKQTQLHLADALTDAALN
ncbi:MULTISPECIES: restriction endonuclease subunit S [Enterobacter]|uniref:restriction endonuclease subunit S n=1 Tax=Enterobacter TaxID=547 RepID=UPI0028EFF499|nr:restriction endonuclease subunit S [Enterobacter cloacae]WNT37005.1 restriction endonuclease subunit S [Enterobacter cloacae]HDR2792937.1 restriction endonuclease subunit S [Enterobacter asburiae]HDR2798044.1 restriction endonuclease subunit S [Enterobacter asburiae]